MELELIQNKIYEIRNYRVMLDFDLATMYQVETKNLKRAVRRNIERFPPDFMFELTEIEWNILRCQNFTSKKSNDLEKENRGGTRYLPFAFTEQGVAQLSSILNNTYAIEINISIIRAFVAIRNYILQQSVLSKEIEDLWKAINDLSEDNRKEFDDIYLALTELASKQKIQDKPRIPIGYTVDRYKNKEK